jgi:hypothetical protein
MPCSQFTVEFFFILIGIVSCKVISSNDMRGLICAVFMVGPIQVHSEF